MDASTHSPRSSIRTTRYEGPDGAQLDELQMLVAGYRAGFPDFRVAITTEIADGDLVAMTMTLTGTHDGEFDGIPATGERLSLPLAVFTRIEDGRIIQDCEFYDTGTMLAQLGPGGGQAGRRWTRPTFRRRAGGDSPTSG